MELKTYARERVREVEKHAFIGPILAGAARAIPAAVRGLGGLLARKAAPAGMSATKKGLGGKLMNGLNTAGNVSMVGSALRPAERPRMEA